MAKVQAKIQAKDILVATKPPLTRQIAQSMQKTIEQALEVVLTDEQQLKFEQQLIAEWKANTDSRKAIAATRSQFAQIQADIMAMPVTKQTLAWREIGRQLYIYAEREGKDDPVG